MALNCNGRVQMSVTQMFPAMKLICSGTGWSCRFPARDGVSVGPFGPTVQSADKSRDRALESNKAALDLFQPVAEPGRFTADRDDHVTALCVPFHGR